MKKLLILIVLALSCSTSAASADMSASKSSTPRQITLQVIRTQVDLPVSSFTSARMIKTPTGHYDVLVEFTPKGSVQILELTSKNIGRPVNIVVNDQIISTAIIQSAVGRQFRISGLTHQKAKAFVDSTKS